MTLRVGSIRELERLTDKACRRQARKERQQLEEEPDAANTPISFWLPMPPSVNRLYYTEKATVEGKAPPRHMASEGSEWKAEVQEFAGLEALSRGWKLTRHSKVVVELVAYWPDDGRRHDIHNLHKIIADALEGVIYADDKMALLRDMDFHTAAGRPKVVVKIWQMMEEEK